ncbi:MULTISPECIES: DUF1615 domain-containing protein [Deefgea]|uniref:DUF1615 family protein n=1 Tax=Deefgea chitinilytica TaxID=570276 RepID=A0ABS2CDY1_9NEIS|nr:MULTISPECIES: DUF1615 domain-containing protein [Deefgea]MBM5572336.1 DUF1615 family protein [Deefgea chitinilytica]MBM9889572.1 DUF1615 family protein [Deefgea sp. CFH1-16]
MSLRSVVAISIGGVLVGCATTSTVPSSVPNPLPTVTPVVTLTPTPQPSPIPSATGRVEPTPAPTPVTTATPKPALSINEARVLLNQLLPPNMPDRAGWNADILDAFTALKLPYTAEYFCAAAATIEQESSWQGDPTVPGLPKIVWNAIGERAEKYHIPLIAVQTALLKTSPTGRSYKERIDTLRTEREMNDLFEDLADEAEKLKLPLNMKNPIRTGGPMQVSVEFAQGHVKAWPYPYPMKGSVRNEVFTRRGGTYFGVAILLQYPAPYTDMVYRFADFNAGRYASRNVAFQQVVAKLTGQALVLDGDLLRYSGGVPTGVSGTQAAVYGLASKLAMSQDAILRDLKQEKLAAFAQTELYKKTFALYEKNGQTHPRAAMPQIDLKSPKITRKLTTEWFANRVKGRYDTCMARR